MNINPLNQALSAVIEPTAPSAADGDAFTKMMAQLGLTPEAAPDVPVDPTLAERAVETVVAGMRHAASISPEVETLAPASDDETSEPWGSSGSPLSLSELPPLLAALLGPALQPAAAAPATPGQAGDASPKALVPQSVASPADASGQNHAPADPRNLPINPSPAAVPALPAHAVHPRFARVAAHTPPGRSAVAEAPATAGADPPAVAQLRLAVDGPSPTPGPQVAQPEAASAPTEMDAPSPAEPLIEQQLDLAHEGEWLDQLAKDIARTAGGEGNLRFRLNPEHLGSLHVELAQGSAGASVRLTADTEAARAILADAQPRLIAEARAQGVRIAEAHVDLGGHSQPQAGGGHRDGRDLPEREYLTTYKPESGEDMPEPPRRSSSERYA